MSQLAKLRRGTRRVGSTRLGTLEAPAFLEFFSSTMCNVFTCFRSLFPFSDTCLLRDLREQNGASVVRLTDIKVLIVADYHAGKTVLILGLGTWVKGKGALPE